MSKEARDLSFNDGRASDGRLIDRDVEATEQIKAMMERLQAAHALREGPLCRIRLNQRSKRSHPK